ncbi:hypothetical protein JHK86_050051 [Glycine max]|nr:hypothetical protein JHK86_050051 [Glycine max]
MHINVSIPDKISRAKKQDHSIDQLVNATVSMSSSMEQSNRRTNVDNASEQGHHNANFEIEALEAARGATLQRSLGIPEQGHHSANFEIEALEAARGAALQRSLGFFN